MGRVSWLVVVLAVLAIVDLWSELQLLGEHFTWSSLGYAVGQHPLAVFVLLLLILRPIRLR
ncbi:MAG: hypothetical protein RLZZ374_38 [Cyanobacteriota bacterium]|jgi:hypothetical protein|nr:hypothetical protein [Synechococcales cyanobacterium SupBloom_Metag_052]